MKYVRALVLGSVLLATPACSSLPGLIADAVLPGDSGLSVDAELTVGDKEEQVNTELQAGDRIQGENVTVNETNTVSPFILLLLIAGWVLPTPQGLWRSWRSRK